MPVRFVRACRAGHIGDIDWYAFVHEGDKECRRQLWIDERGTSGDLAEVYVRCECKDERNMAQATDMRALGNCNGNRPWLGPFEKEKCGEPNRLLIRTASNAYFPQSMSVISLPDRDETIKEAVDAVWDFLEEVEDIEQFKYERKKDKVKKALEGISDEEAFAEIRASGAGFLQPDKSVKQVELETLIASKDELGDGSQRRNEPGHRGRSPRIVRPRHRVRPSRRLCGLSRTTRFPVPRRSNVAGSGPRCSTVSGHPAEVW